MKKFLSLVLALVMTMSLVTVSAGAKDFTDSSKIQYAEAVDVMSAVKVIDGYAEGDFRPTATLTRGAAAKIICNLILGPTTASALVADAAPYKDVPTNHTFAGYIAYCQKEGIISGYADGTFKPANSLTGYAFMKMLLGALGYKAEQEGYTGANWSIQVAKRALNIGLADDLVGDFNGVKAVNREEACLYAFNTLKATMVEYDKNSTVIVGNITIKEQSDAKDMTNTGKTDGNIDKDGKMQFAEKYFEDLKKFGATDDFSRPATQWKIKAEEVGKYTDTPDLTYTAGTKIGTIYSDLGLSDGISKKNVTEYVDGVYAGARILEILSREADPSAALEALPSAVNTPELQIRMAEGENKAFIARLQKEARFDDALDVITIDGVRVEWNDGFALARSSNTTPVVVLRLEGDTPEALERIKKTFAEVLLKVEPSLELPF